MSPLANTTFLPTPIGQLEVVTEKPVLSSGFSGIGIVCHPHPLHGGTMNNKVVTTMAKIFREHHFMSIRFNFRGVGQSEGIYDEGMGETEDLLNIINWIKKAYPETPVSLAGFSFGAFVALNAAHQIPVQQLISLAPAVKHADFTGLHPHCPWVVVIAEKDSIANPKDIYAWIQTLSPQPQIISIPNASHFFDGQLITLKNQLKSYLI